MTRREFLQAGAAAATTFEEKRSGAPALLNPERLTKFVDRLALPPVARTSRTRSSPSAANTRVASYRFAMRQIAGRVHRDLPATAMWGVGSSFPGPTIEARHNTPIFIEWVNELPLRHLLAVEDPMQGAHTNHPQVRTIIHLHGGRVPPASDGYPENWYLPGRSLLNFYPNCQDAATLWYHDHAMGITRFNVLAGLFGLYLLRDEAEEALNLPRGPHELPLLLCDRSFHVDGTLYYPASDNPARPWISEFSGDAILANGTLFPFFEAEARRYRLRLLNASNSRFLYLAFSNGQSFWQMGSDQGLLPTSIELRRLTLAPGERADVVIDFQSLRGQNVVLESDSHAIVQFRISWKRSEDSSSLPPHPRDVPRMAETEAIATRLLTLDGTGDSDDPTSMVQPMLLNGARWSDPVTEKPALGTTEIWSLVNLTDDSHPIHLHLVRFQILDRRPFDLFTYLNERKLRYTAAAIQPDPNELGWKDTVRADPGMVTRIIIRFEGFAGRYVWHCHVLEHEDHEMMRPYDVLPAVE